MRRVDEGAVRGEDPYMLERTMLTLLGFAPKELDGQGPYKIFADLGDGPVALASAETMGEACERLPNALFGEEFPDYDPSVIDEFPALDGESLEARALVYELSETMLMARTRDPDALASLAPVLQDNPDLRLVVAWEAVSHRQDSAIGIFRVAAET